MSDTQRAIGLALVHLSAARDLLKVIHAKRPVTKVRAAITATQNHMEKVK